MIPADITLGILAGGRATRLGGIDKAWLQRDGIAQLERLARHFERQVACILLSSNRDPARHASDASGLSIVTDRVTGAGPLAGLDALANACATPWLFTLPVDVVDVDHALLPALTAANSGNGAFAEDDDGPQPLVALWRVAALREASSQALVNADLAVHSLQTRLGMACLRLTGVRFGNLNTPDDLVAAGFQHPHE